MKDRIDAHSHTLVSGHAYNTINEMTQAAAEKGLEILGITEHAPMMAGSCVEMYFHNLHVVSREKFGVELLLGVELNILDQRGRVDLPKHVLKYQDLVIASMHTPCIRPGNAEENTAAYINAMKNPFVDIIGHPDDGRFPIDVKALVKAAKEEHVLLELNNNSLNPRNFRVNSEENAIEILKECHIQGVSIIMGSDAHTDTDVGRHDRCIDLIDSIDFPLELVVNYSTNEFKSYVNKYKSLL